MHEHDFNALNKNKAAFLNHLKSKLPEYRNVGSIDSVYRGLSNSNRPNRSYYMHLIASYKSLRNMNRPNRYRKYAPRRATPKRSWLEKLFGSRK